MKAISMQAVFDAAERAGHPIGNDGTAVPLDVADVMPIECSCDGSGEVPVMLNGVTIATVPCAGCSRG